MVWGAVAFGRSPTKVPIPPPLSCGGGTGASKAARLPRPLSCGLAGGERVVRIVGDVVGMEMSPVGHCLWLRDVGLCVGVGSGVGCGLRA